MSQQTQNSSSVPQDGRAASAAPLAGCSRRQLLQLAAIAAAVKTEEALQPAPAHAALVQFPTSRLKNSYLLVNIHALSFVSIHALFNSTWPRFAVQKA